MLTGNPIVNRTKPYKLWDGFGHVLEIIKCGIRRRDLLSQWFAGNASRPIVIASDDEKRDLPELRDYVLKAVALEAGCPDDAQKMCLWK